MPFDGWKGRSAMKRLWVFLLCVLLALSAAGCAKKDAVVKNTVEGNLKTYSQMSDGTWVCDGNTYKYRLEIGGRMPNAVKDTSFVYLSNIRKISFEQAYKAAGISSDLADYFSPEEAVLVEMSE